jgi:hypothetical protein
VDNASARILKPWKEILETMGYGTDGALCLWLKFSEISHVANKKTVKHSLLNKVLEFRSQSNSGLASRLHFVKILQSFWVLLVLAL